MNKAHDFLDIIKINFKVSIRENLILALSLIVLTPIIYSLKNLDGPNCAVICEKFISIIGIFLITPIFFEERRDNIFEITDSKTLNSFKIYIIRFLIGIFLISLLVILFVYTLIALGGEFKPLSYILGTIITAIFLGSIGIFFESLTEQLSIGYLVPIGYIMMDMFTNGKYTKNFYLFSMTKGSFKEKYYLLLGGLILLILAFIIRCVKKDK